MNHCTVLTLWLIACVSTASAQSGSGSSIIENEIGTVSSPTFSPIPSTTRVTGHSSSSPSFSSTQSSSLTSATVSLQPTETTTLATEQVTPTETTTLATEQVTPTETTTLATEQVTPTETTTLATEQVTPTETTTLATEPVTPTETTTLATEQVTPTETTTPTTEQVTPTETTTLATEQVTPTETTTLATEQVTPTETTTPATEPVTTSSQPFTTLPSSVNNGQWVAVGVVSAVLLVLAVVAGVLCCCVLHKVSVSKGALRKLSVTSSKKLIEVPLVDMNGGNGTNSQDILFAHLTAAQLASFPAESLPSYVDQLHEEDSYRADDEYDDLKDLDPTVSTAHATLQCNESRNRYTNILPRDSTRVTLNPISKVPGSDYINANFINGYNRPREYIAAQGPLPATCADFWRMIWEHNIHTVVMVTNIEENQMVKCHQYWPARGTAQFGTTAITLERQVLFPEFIIRELGVTSVSKKKTNQVGVKRTVTQYHFTVWPDFGVPKEASAMIKFVRKIRRSVDAEHGPMLIHCSAGVGRTGTYIAVDVLTQKMDAGEMINVQEFVCEMRAQRSLMVQTSAQYLFIYDALLHYYLYGNKEVSAECLPAYVASMDTPQEDKGGTTPLDREFEDVSSVRLSNDSFFTIATDDANSHKNRDNFNLPLDDNRVVLEDLDAAPGQDYINASFITGYYNRVEFIVTQHPLHSTLEDFWNMIVERKVKCIIMFGPLGNKEDCYWPMGYEQPCTFDSGVTVSLVESEDEDGLAIREMKIDSVKNKDSAHTLRQFHLHSWPVGGVPANTTPTLEMIEKSRVHWRETGFNLILVHTAAGVISEAAGVYCGLCVLTRQLEVEDCVDVFTAVQKLKRQRPSIIASKDYYRFLYSALESTLEEEEEEQ